MAWREPFWRTGKQVPRRLRRFGMTMTWRRFGVTSRLRGGCGLSVDLFDLVAIAVFDYAAA
jgi:hypothetical protein